MKPPDDDVMDDDALSRILDAAGAKYVPKELDRAKLRTAIVLAGVIRGTVSALKARPAEDGRLRDILDATESLKTLLQEDVQAQRLALWRYPLNERDPIAVLEAVARSVRGALDSSAAAPDGSAFDWAISALAIAYEEHIGRKAGASRHPEGGQPTGPFIRFAEAALRELKIFNTAGEPYSTEAIARACASGRRA
jgi:hypothetical protein